jgi:acyl-homoserine-lactone acylase
MSKNTNIQYSHNANHKKNDSLLFNFKALNFLYIITLIFFFSNNAFSNEQQADVISPGYRAQIQRTAHNVAHITAQDLPSAWFGQGYAMAEDRICTVLDQVIKIRSQRARFFGAGDSKANIDSDFAYLHLGLVTTARHKWKALPENIQDMLKAHAAGINAYVVAVGAEELPELCRNVDWVVQVTAIDLLAYSIDFGLSSFSKPLLKQLSNTFPPNSKFESDETTSPEADSTLEPITPKKDNGIGSNGWGLGAEMTDSGNGMLLANPHFPWEGELKLWESHITVPGEIDVYGVTLPGIPNTLIGFNKAVAWTLAVSSAAHETFYKLKLVPDEPTKYLYDGEVRSMKSSEHKIDVRNIETGEIEQDTRILWYSHYGPIVSLASGMKWNKETALSYRDANLDYSTYLSQFFEMSRASDLNGFIEAHKNSVGMPFGHTVATSLEGDAWYADGSPVPDISPETYAAWQQNVESDTIVSNLWRGGFYVLDGSTSRDEWVESAESSLSGLLPYAEKPQLLRRDFVFNSNDNHWLSNPESPLEGLNPLYGIERSPRSLRTRANADALSKGKADKGKFSLEKVQTIALSNRSFTGKLLREELVNHCKTMPIVKIGEDSADLTKACQVLAEWDETFDLDSKGAVLFREFLGTFNPTLDFTDQGNLFAVPFDPENPIATPNGLVVSEGEHNDSVLLRLAQVVKRLTDANFAIDSTLRDLQFTQKGEARIPIHGGSNEEGLLNITQYALGSSNSTLFPTIAIDNVLNPMTGLTKEGYFINSGTSFLMAVELTNTGPQCQAILTYSQSDDPESPFFADQTQLFSEKKWHQCLYDQKDIDADPALKTYSVHALTGDIDRDGDIDRADVMLIHFVREMPVTKKIARYDLNNDGEITALDVNYATDLCTYSQCAIK